MTAPFHTSRARRAFLHGLRGSPVSVVMRPAPLGDFRPEDWWRHRLALTAGILEWQKTLFYWIRYW